jgi:uncharacterized protein
MPAATDLGLMVVLGATSSLHCTTMCGPLIAVASAPLAGDRTRIGRLAAWQGAYHLGRGVAYGAIGGLLALLGTALTGLFAARQVGGLLQVAVGLVIVGLGVWQLNKGAVAGSGGGPIARAVGRLVTSGHGRGLFALGLLTGLLPCGVLYAAFARAVAAGSASEGALLLLAFWAGTVPLLATVGLASGSLVRAAGRLAPVLLFLAMSATGGWLSWKGAHNLGLLGVPPAACPHHGAAAPS